MTSKNMLILKMEGPAQSGRHLELSVFVEKTRQFHNFLKVSAKDSGADGITFDVVALSHSSPAFIGCVPVSRGGDVPPSAIVNRIKETLDLTQERQTRGLSHPVLDSLEKLVNHNPNKIRTIEIQAGDGDADNAKRYRLDEEFKQNLREARRQEDRDISTVDGKLEQINIHKNANTFRIYTFASSSVVCKFPKDMQNSVQSALGRFVSVRGECFYRPNARFPHKINAREMEILPPAEELPSLSDLQGIAPGATGGKSSEQFVRELRDEWDRDTR